ESTPETKAEIAEVKTEPKEEPKEEPRAELNVKTNAEEKAEVKVEAKPETDVAANTEKEKNETGAIIAENTPASEKGLPVNTEAEKTIAEVVLPSNPPLNAFEVPIQNLMNVELAANLTAPANEDLEAPLPPKNSRETRASRTEVERPLEAMSRGPVELPETPNLPGWRERPAALAAWAQPQQLFGPEDSSLALVTEDTAPAPEPSEIIAPRPVVKESAKETVVSKEKTTQPNKPKTSRPSKLPPEIEKRAAAVGLSSGKLTRSLALGNEKPKNSPQPEPNQAESQAQPLQDQPPMPATRPRRVTEAKEEPISNAPTQRKRRVN
ncbi:MAG TPA: hypothetical protein VEF04_11880, partial [Blastocatellia bacterium]|nr:hypothetical protein [Blastocatellia bacterium]